MGLILCMENPQQYNSYEPAFSEMHRLTASTTPFKLTFKRVNGTVCIVPKALLRKQTTSDKDKNGAYKFNYIDVEHDRCGTAYIPLLLAVNDKQVRL